MASQPNYYDLACEILSPRGKSPVLVHVLPDDDGTGFIPDDLLRRIRDGVDKQIRDYKMAPSTSRAR